MKPLRTYDLSTVSTPDCDEDLILHKAAGILRKHICDVVTQSDAYPSPADTSLSQSQKIMPPILKTFLCWLLDGDSYETLSTNDKPKERMEPIRHEDAYEKITSCDARSAETSDIAWVFLRFLSRHTVEFPIGNHLPTGDKQIIPFWTGYHRKTSVYCRYFSIVSYAPIVDSKPSDMATVYTTMKICVDMCMKYGQQYSVETFD
ncbi:unnamed protein product [Mytilus coruscus]|uniref:Uncharacterized protein n=1 Tax=Mytilus coruscus TaxID=42192 RepID=A0A6J8BEZ2_MYTCO|nr:unnamed protein product [Mytilus coruscus]